jgi:hypothetical protein
MTVTQSIIQSEISPSFNTVTMVAALQSELATLRAKVESYYHDEVVLRGDKIMMREYRGHFGIES